MANHVRPRKSALHLSPELHRRTEPLASAARRPLPSDDRVRGHHRVKVALFFLTMAVGAVVVWLLPLRPTHSDVENRDLATFPAFSAEVLASGDYFDDITTWFADTFPGREQWGKGQGLWQGLYGIQQQAIYGPVVSGDDIPDTPTLPSGDGGTLPTLPTVPTGTTQPTAPTTPSTAPSTTSPTTPPTKPTGGNDGPITELGSVLVVGQSAYEYYNFSQNTADSYVAAMNHAGERLQGIANVYDMVVPTSIDVMLSEAVRLKINSSDQQKAISYIYGRLSDKVYAIPVQDTLRAHNSEYLYFNTDHHWTALGAYYAYEQLMTMKGVTPTPLSAFETREFTGFKGSFYSATQDAGLSANPDTVVAYYPQSDAALVFEDAKGNRTNWNIITNVDNWAARSKYNTFIGGDNAFTEIKNPDKQDGSSIVVVKESFGNALVPFLVDHYQTVYVVDYRYYEGSLVELVQQKGAREVLFINNISATRNASLVGYIGELVAR